MIAIPLCTRLPVISSGILTHVVNNNCKILNNALSRQFTVLKTSVVEREKRCFPSFLMYRYMAGHAKWQNIKHVKAEKDRQKGLLFNKYIRLVNAAVKDKGPDPKANIKLAHLLEEAKRNNVPSSTLESALKKASSKKLQSGTIEMLGPGGFILIMEYETDNLCDMRCSVKVICRKYSAGIYPGGGGRWRAVYEQKGIIKVTSQLNGESFDGEKMLDAAIEAGAEDVQKLDEDNNHFYEFSCAPEDLMTVKKELEKVFVIEEAYVGYIPLSTVTLSEDDRTVAMSFLNEIGDLPDVSRMYENIE